MNLSPAQQAFFDALDETPQCGAGGPIISVRPLKPGERGEFRSRDARRFPRLEAYKARLAIYSHILEREERMA